MLRRVCGVVGVSESDAPRSHRIEGRKESCPRSAPVGSTLPAGRGAGLTEGWVRALLARFAMAGFALTGTGLLARMPVVAALPGLTAPALAARAELSRARPVLVRRGLL